MSARPPIAFRRHDHAACRAGAMAEARERCEAQGARLTPTRRRVLELLLESHAALGAYDVLARLKEEGLGAQPPVAYRALDFLVSHGFAHRIEKLNAYVACAHPGAAHAPAFMICRDCGAVAEMPEAAVTATLAAVAENMGFALEHAVVEAEGLCPGCKEAAA
jgi:Fur family zinc uptake transcriptional regulator